MIAMFATLVFATAGCAGTAVIGTSIRNALPKARLLSGQVRAQRQALAADPLALDRVYLVSLIETPRHDGTPAPVPAIAAPMAAAAKSMVVARVAAKRVAKGQARHNAQADARRFTAARFHAAA